jgi:hypothetical protein
MDVFARRAFERSDVEAHGAGCNPRQHSSCLARGADWSPDGHDAIVFGSGGSVTELRGDGDGASMELPLSRRWSKLLIFQKLMTPLSATAWSLHAGMAFRRSDHPCLTEPERQSGTLDLSQGAGPISEAASGSNVAILRLLAIALSRGRLPFAWRREWVAHDGDAL